MSFFDIVLCGLGPIYGGAGTPTSNSNMIQGGTSQGKVIAPLDELYVSVIV